MWLFIYTFVLTDPSFYKEQAFLVLGGRLKVSNNYKIMSHVTIADYTLH